MVGAIRSTGSYGTASNKSNVVSQMGKPGFIDSGCVLYLPLWSAGLTGSPVYSVDSNGHECTVSGATWTSQGRTFDGNDYVTTTFVTALDLGDLSAFTLVAWFKVTDVTQTQCVVGLGSTASDTPIIQLQVIDSKIRGYQRDDATNVSLKEIAIVNDTWYMATFVRRAVNSIEVYLNADSGGTESTTIGATTLDNFNIGRLLRTSAGAYITGTIGEVYIYSYGLSASAISRHYYATSWRFS